MPTFPTELLAKSPHSIHLTLEQHCFDTEQAAIHLFRENSRLAQNWTKFFKLSHTDQTRFLLNLQIACLFHDIGKANLDFQNAVTGKLKIPQTLRHEHISALILSLPEVRLWLNKNTNLDIEIITAAVLSHHLKASDSGDYNWGSPRTILFTAQVCLFLDHPDIIAIFKRVQTIAQLDVLPLLPTAPWTETEKIWKDALIAGRKNAKLFDREFRKPSCIRKPLLLAIKAAVIISDSVASGIVRTGENIINWIEKVIHKSAITLDDLNKDIIQPRIISIEKRNKKTFEFHRFQILASEQGERTLLLSGCGSGKTLAAWKWAESILKNNKFGHVIFLYPTRGTATEGFRDYVGWAPEIDAALMHSTSEYELEAMAENPSDSTKNKNYLKETNERLFALGFWPKRYFSATIDQFFSFLEHRYRGLCLLPVLTDSVIILDEIHSYDRKMFSDLVAFLTNFNIPVLCMTATLSKYRREILSKCGLQFFPREEHRKELEDLNIQECQPRYIINKSDKNKIIEKVFNSFENKRILWVVNTVNRCQQIATKLSEKIDDVLIYHSRFKLDDRNSAHNKVVDAFKNKKTVIAVTTQVCEMSLDLDADILITELAPVSSIVQRFGRSNRSLNRNIDERAEIFWYEPPTSWPYNTNELNLAQKFLLNFENKPTSQRQLSEGLELYSLDEIKPNDNALFLTSGYYATPGNFRDTDDFSQSCVLDCDVEKVIALYRARQSYDGFILPVPRNILVKENKDLPKYISIISSEYYDSHYGLIIDKM